MKLNKVRVKIIENASAAGLETDIAVWLATQTEAELVDMQFMADGTHYSVMITYGQ